jgi:hypothetical protein
MAFLRDPTHLEEGRGESVCFLLLSFDSPTRHRARYRADPSKMWAHVSHFKGKVCGELGGVRMHAI